VVESSALLKRRTPKGYRGFESLPHRSHRRFGKTGDCITLSHNNAANIRRCSCLSHDGNLRPLPTGYVRRAVFGAHHVRTNFWTASGVKTAGAPLRREYEARTVPTVDAADFSELSEAEEKHFYKCSRCGEMIDKRQLDDVLFHEDHIHRPDIQYGGSLRVEEATRAARDQDSG
jgi:hypothetical protein